MASNKSYAYYVKGDKIALVQRNSTDSNATGESYHEFKSPTEAVTNGIEIEYTRAPWFEYDHITSASLSSSSYLNNSSVDGINYLYYTLVGSNVASTYVVNDYVFIKGIGKWSGLHKIKTSAYAGGNTVVVFNTRVHADNLSNIESGTIYYVVTALEDENSDNYLPF